ncbi:MAG: DUF1232 domain-containing protein [Pseudomonadota bacterium]
MRRLLTDLAVLWLAARDRRVSWAAKALAAAVVLYAVSPIDLIPDAIPVIGLLDDLLLVPAGIWLILRLIPAPVLADLRAQARAHPIRLPGGRIGTVCVVIVWVGLAAFVVWWLV